YLNDVQRSGFYASLGRDARQYDTEVIRKTNESAGRLFPIILDVEDPKFFSQLDSCTKNTAAISEISQSGQPKVLQTLRKLPHILAIGTKLVNLYFIKPISMADNREIVR
ncbi:MAG: magnesium-protoporphyrin IX monomethyl ester cyclase, partial [Phormidesmis sp.]